MWPKKIQQQAAETAYPSFEGTGSSSKMAKLSQMAKKNKGFVKLTPIKKENYNG